MTIQTSFNPDETTPTVAVVNALADVTDTPPLELPPLYDSIDPDTLDNVTDYGPGAIFQFSHGGYQVTVHGSGRIVLQPVSNGATDVAP
jgi:hypothetical protein